MQTERADFEEVVAGVLAGDVRVGSVAEKGVSCAEGERESQLAKVERNVA